MPKKRTTINIVLCTLVWPTNSGFVTTTATMQVKPSLICSPLKSKSWKKKLYYHQTCLPWKTKLVNDVTALVLLYLDILLLFTKGVDSSCYWSFRTINVCSAINGVDAIGISQHCVWIYIYIPVIQQHWMRSIGSCSE